MPYTPPSDVAAPPSQPDDNEELSLRYRQAEMQVRLTAQRILAGYVAVSQAGGDLHIDLTGATLIDFTLQGQVALASFADARFYGAAHFGGLKFNREARYDRAIFHGAASFSPAKISSIYFHCTEFHGGVWFDAASIGQHASFTEATFHCRLGFEAVSLDEYASVNLSDARILNLAGRIPPRGPVNHYHWPPDWDVPPPGWAIHIDPQDTNSGTLVRETRDKKAHALRGYDGAA